jgi:hypothetical protein
MACAARPASIGAQRTSRRSHGGFLLPVLGGVVQTYEARATAMSWKLRWAGWNRGMRRVRLANGKYGYVSSLVEPIGDKKRIKSAQSIASAINKAAAQGDREEVERLQLLAEQMAEEHRKRN